jgi:hypothetical protein
MQHAEHCRVPPRGSGLRASLRRELALHETRLLLLALLLLLVVTSAAATVAAVVAVIVAAEVGASEAVSVQKQQQRGEAAGKTG